MTSGAGSALRPADYIRCAAVFNGKLQAARQGRISKNGAAVSQFQGGRPSDWASRPYLTQHFDSCSPGRAKREGSVPLHLRDLNHAKGVHNRDQLTGLAIGISAFQR